MDIRVREADIESDGDALLDALSRYLNPLADRARFDWLYKNNPHGKVRAWIAFDNAGRTVVGTAAVFPRRVYNRDSEAIAWVLGDFCINDTYRALGPALTLQRAVLSALEPSGIPFCYDFPGRAMTAVYKRLKVEVFAEMIRLAKVVRVDRKLREHVRSELLVNIMSAVGNAFLKVTAFRPEINKSVTMSLHKEKCGPEFDVLTGRVGPGFGFCVQRSADYINWRYLQNPYKKHELLTAKRDGTLVGFAVFAQNGLDGAIVDVFGENNSVVLGGLIRELIEILRRRGVATISAELIASHPWIGLFKGLGFYPREHKPLIVYWPRHSQSQSASSDGSAVRSWFVTGGDRDS